MGKAPPVNPSSPATPKKGSKVGGKKIVIKTYLDLEFKKRLEEQG